MIKANAFALASLRSAHALLWQRAQSLASDLAGAGRLIDVPMIGRLFGFTDVAGTIEPVELRRTTRLLLTGLALWIVTVVAITLIAIASVEISTLDLSGWLTPKPAVDVASSVAPAKRYEDILRRPLFARSRQAASALPMPVALQLPPPRDRAITLKGVYIDGKTAKAFLISQQSPLGAWVRAGQDIGDWKIVAIGPNQVELKAQNENLVILLGSRDAGK